MRRRNLMRNLKNHQKQGEQHSPITAKSQKMEKLKFHS